MKSWLFAEFMLWMYWCWFVEVDSHLADRCQWADDGDENVMSRNRVHKMCYDNVHIVKKDASLCALDVSWWTARDPSWVATLRHACFASEVSFGILFVRQAIALTTSSKLHREHQLKTILTGVAPSFQDTRQRTLHAPTMNYFTAQHRCRGVKLILYTLLLQTLNPRVLINSLPLQSTIVNQHIHPFSHNPSSSAEKCYRLLPLSPSSLLYHVHLPTHSPYQR